MRAITRLVEKGLLGRTMAKNTFIYHARVTQDELDCDLAANVVQSLLGQDDRDPMPLLSSLIDAVSGRDVSLLDDLERLIRKNASLGPLRAEGRRQPRPQT